MLTITSAARGGRHRWGAALVVFGLVLVSGCNPDPYPEDLHYPVRSDVLVLKEPNKRDIPHPEPLGHFEQAMDDLKNVEGASVLDPSSLPGDQRGELESELEQVFGTPAKPTVAPPAKDKDSQAAVKTLKLDDETLARGSILYRRHCVHCHGLTGDGRGPTAPWVNPHPRDYRRGYFKFISTLDSSNETSDVRKPRRSDLLRTLREGIEGTSMPNFRLLADEELQALISYIIHLSVRGEVEFNTIRALLSKSRATVAQLVRTGNPRDPEDPRSETAKILGNWTDDSKPLEPLAYPFENAGKEEREASVKRGFELFKDANGAACIGCHNDYGRQAGYLYDKWGTLVRPANLTAGVYRGGRRPVDLYYRIFGGIPPSGMPATASAIKKDKQKMWDLVNFVQALPYPHMLPDDVREQIYGTKKD